MKVLAIARLFSGLADSALKGSWNPKGVPAFAKLIEGLHADHNINLRTVLFCRDPDDRFHEIITWHTEASGDLVLIPYKRPTRGHFRKVDRVATEIFHILISIYFFLKFRPQMVYSSFAMTLSASLFARYTNARTVLRFMGINPPHRAIADGYGNRVIAWALNAPFDMVVASEDGSDPSRIIDKLIANDTPRIIRMNGCDLPIFVEEKQLTSDSRLAVGFINRLEPNKGTLQFIEAALIAASKAPDDFIFHIVGDGSLREEVDKLEANCNFKIHGELSHTDALALISNIDICVSVNLYGNLSNSNLEAIAAGVCLVIPTFDPLNGIDISTQKFLPESIFPRFERNKLPVSLSDLLTSLNQDRERITDLKANTRSFSKNFLHSWEEVIAVDIRLIKDLI